ncbi:GDSL esterase/lipase At5g33370-like [Hibiscus syriacus]|uniref:GDSL esterase/lipase At5g33370-like n=1 Tax=Hibiscus syriacus TaxID=106335 RepID=UPI00192153EC|nr:GDSL esterase/lipase At5g33370-like [Hibiscus syriacus]
MRTLCPLSIFPSSEGNWSPADSCLPPQSSVAGYREMVFITISGDGFGLGKETLYEAGARRVLVTGTGPMGCVPAELAMRGTNGGCSKELQRAASLYNPQLVQMLNGLNKQIGKDVFVSANTQHAQRFRFVTSQIACCGQGPYNGLGLCTDQLSNLCPNKAVYAFWDPFHPSEKANRLIVEQIMTGSNEYIHPMNLSSVIATDSRI